MNNIEDNALDDAIEKVLIDFIIYQLHNKLGRYSKFKSLLIELKAQSIIDDFQVWSEGSSIVGRVYKDNMRRQFSVPILSDKAVSEIENDLLNSISIECKKNEEVQLS